MNISLNLTKTDSNGQNRKELISLRVQPIIDDKYFINDFVNKQSFITDDHSNNRTLIGNYYFDEKAGSLGSGINVYLIYTKDKGILIVGIVSKSGGGIVADKAVLFELPISQSDAAIAQAEELGFKISPPDNDVQWLDSDFISETYFNGDTVLTTNTTTSYQKTIADKYHLYITTEQ